MSFTLDINSAFRNRNQYPNASEFALNIGNQTVKLKNNADDPISLAAPLVSFTPNKLDKINPSATANNEITLNIVSKTSFTIVAQPTAGEELHTEDDYYTNLSVVTTGSVYLIDGYEYMGKIDYGGGSGLKDTGLFYIINLGAEDDNLLPSTSFDIKDNRTSTFGGSVTSLWIPNNLCINFDNYFLYNESLGTAVKISDHDVNQSTILFSDTTFLATHNYSIRRELPRFFQNINTTDSTQTYITVNTEVPNDLIYNFIRIINDDEYSYPLANPKNHIAKIMSIDYDPGTNKSNIYIQPNLSSLSFGTNPKIEFMMFSRDNNMSYGFIPKSISSTNMPYKLTLTNISLPIKKKYKIPVPFFLYLQVSNENRTSSKSLITNNQNILGNTFKLHVHKVLKDKTLDVKVLNPTIISNLNIHENLIIKLCDIDGITYTKNDTDNVSPRIPVYKNQISGTILIEHI